VNDKVTVPEAAKLLGISEGAIRQRIHRGSLEAEKDDTGRVYVSLTPEDTQNNGVNTAETDDSVTELVHELRDRIRFLEDELADRKEENRRKDAILMTLAQRVPELEEASEPRESPVTATEVQGEGMVPPEAQRRSWWRRIFAT
jgi:excisionase family DNA binding protein